MSDIYAEFEQELSGWRTRYQGRPEQEAIALCLLSLQREEIVSFTYHEQVLGRRLAAMAIPDEAREVIQHALTWAWLDEQMHAIYIRGTLLKLGSARLRALAFAHQAAGALGGWATSVHQHATWREAPLSRIAATLLTGLGRLSGQVPRAVRAHLEYGTFRRFCLFNVEAERTAWLCWSRLSELAPHMPRLAPGSEREFRRVQDDEERHRRVFEIIADALDDEDRLRPGATASTLVARIAQVGEFFLPRRHRTGSAHQPLGSGGAVWVVTGREADDKRRLLRELLEETRLAEAMRAQAAALGKARSDLRVAVKPTFMLGYDRRDPSILTDADLLDELARWLRERGCADVAVVESANIYERFYRHRSVAEVARYFGYASPHYRLVDASAEQVPHEYFRGMAQCTVARTWKEADFRISFAKMRSHPVELVHLSLGNVEWMGGRCDQFLFVERQAQRETATMMMLDEFPPHFALLDAYEHAADGLAGVMGCPRPRAPRRLYASADALALDLVAGRHMGLVDPRESSLLRAAFHWFGAPEVAVEVRGVDEPVVGWRSPYHNELSALLSLLAYPVYVLGSGRGAVFVPPMDEEAFPPVAPPSFLLRTARAAIQRLLGLRLPT